MLSAFVHEPRLEFASGDHIDIRFGMINHGPFDALAEFSPQRVRLGVVGTSEAVESVHEWIERIGLGIDAKKSRQPNLFP